MALSEKLLSMLVCPKCRKPLEYHAPTNTLLCRESNLRFKVEDDIPVLLLDEAEALEQ